MPKNNKIIITAFPRIHITLIGMNDTGYRINGGIGFSLNEPNIKANICASNDFSFKDKRNIPFNQEEISRLKVIINDVVENKKFKKNISILINGDIDTHSGFGTGTIIRLLCLEALFIINNSQYTKKIIQKLSKRGGTSGIGIRTYFNGGFVFDIGHERDRLIPSSIAEDTPRKSLILKHTRMPDWKIGLCLPHFIPSLTPDQEKLFFKETVPITQKEVNDVLYHSVYGVYASIKEKNLKSFNEAIKNIQDCKWKKSERESYGIKIKMIEKILYKAGAHCVGMSSLGPTLFFTGDNLESIILNAKKALGYRKCTFVQTKTSNTGRIIEQC